MGFLLPVVVIAVIVIAVKNRSAAATLDSTTGPRTSGIKGQATRSPLQDKLDDWVDAEFIDADQANAVLVYEIDRVPPSPNRLPLAAEAVGYIGSGLVLASVALLVGNRWDDMSTTERIASLALPTVVAAVAGWWTGRGGEPALERLGSVLWALAVVGVAGLAAEVWVDLIHGGDPPDHHAALFIGAIALMAAAWAWWMRRLVLQQLALFGAAVTTSLGVIDSAAAGRDRAMSAQAVGLTLLALGVVWLAASLARRLPPALLANVLGSAVILLGAQILRFDNDQQAGLLIGMMAAIILMTVGVSRSELEILFVGTVGLFQWTPQIALFYLEDTLGAEATLFVIGLLLIVLAGLLTRMYPWVKARHHERSSEIERPTRSEKQPQHV